MKSIAHSGLARLLLTLFSGFLLCSCNRGLPSKLDRLPAELTNPALRISGIYEDAWVGEKGSLDLEQRKGDEIVSIRGTVPQIGDAHFQIELELRLDDQALAHWDLRPGDFAVSAPVPTGAGTRRVALEFSRSQQLPGDGRSVGARLSFIGFEPQSGQKGAPSDITRGLNLQLGSSWGVLETFHNETFRWVDNDAQVAVAADQPGSYVLSLVLEPGPGVGGQPFLLKVLDAGGRQISAEPVPRRQRVNFIVPVETGNANNFRLHLDGGGRPAPNDPRILNFRVFEAEAQPWKPAK